MASVEKSLDTHVGTGLYPVVAAALTHAHIADAHGKIESLYPHPLSLAVLCTGTKGHIPVVSITQRQHPRWL